MKQVVLVAWNSSLSSIPYSKPSSPLPLKERKFISEINEAYLEIQHDMPIEICMVLIFQGVLTI